MLSLTTRSQTREYMLYEIKSYLETLPDSDRWKDFFEASTGKTTIDILIGIAELLLYKLEVRSLDSYLPTAISQSATYLLSQMISYNPNRKSHSTGNVTFTFRYVPNTSLTIPQGFVIENGSLPLVVAENTTVPVGSNSVTVPVLQGEWVENTYTAPTDFVGKEWEILRVEETDFQVDQEFIYIEIDNELITTVDKVEVVDANSAIVRTDYRGGVLIFFGDGTYGRKLNNTSVVVVKYLRTLGLAGRLPAGTALGSSVISNRVADVVTSSNIQGGSDEDSINKVKFLASRFFQTQGRAVTKHDYIAIIMAFPGVISAKAERIDECCTVAICAIKQKVTLPDQTALWSENEIDELFLYLDDYKMVSTKIVFYQPETINLDLNVKIVVPIILDSGNFLQDIVDYITEEFCYKLGATFYPTQALDSIADAFDDIIRVYFIDDDTQDNINPYNDKFLDYWQYFKPGDIRVSLEVVSRAID